MPPKRRKVLPPSRLRKSQAAPKAQYLQSPKLKINFKLEPREGTAASVSADHLPPTAPQTPDEAPNEALEVEVFEVKEQSVENEQGRKRGARKRTKSHASDMAFGSETDTRISSALMNRPAKRAKVKGDDHVHIASSPPPRPVSPPPPIVTESPPLRDDSSTTVQGDDTPPPRCSDPVSSDVSNIINALQSTSEIQVDLPNLTGPEGSKNYTAAVLIELYIQCYEKSLWDYCDLIADTWIRALQKANKRSHEKSTEDSMWRENRPLEKLFAQNLKGFKKDVQDYGLDVEDPGMGRDVTAISSERLHDLFNNTDPGCGARLLWADSMALGGHKMEHELAQQPDIWPKELFFNVMCTSLRMVRRKLTLKIEERYEGAWCRYHEHAKHGRPCYRRLAWEQGGMTGTRSGQVGEAVANGGSDYDSVYRSEYGGGKHVHFEDGDDVDGGPDATGFVDYEGEDDTGSESEEER
ncbi:hypothetical protein B5807_07038 [Epicoccum nigrum]|uniref:Uncharacterized protein n=1 Tax=Epicoccum nigrum TaxID=105696 RepID=A0A1Y2LZB3_EPING|nr:hypothetical protein B5807_07038 [Epicoccum nigrum]